MANSGVAVNGSVRRVKTQGVYLNTVACYYQFEQFWRSSAKHFCVLFVIILLVSLECAGAVVSATELDLRPSLTWNSSLGHSLFANATDEEQMVEAKFNLQGKYPITPRFFLQGEIALQMKTGMAQHRYPDEAKAPIEFKAAYLQSAITNNVFISAGALPLDYLQSPLLMAAKAFPGSQQRLTWQITSPTKLQITTLQAIPTSSSDASARSEKIPTPWFFAHTGEIETQAPWAKLAVVATHFSYQQLPPKVAYRSAYLGNNLQDYSEPTASFLYPFYGYSVGGKLTIPWQQHWLMLGFQRLENLGAPYGRGRGEIGQVEVGLPLMGNIFSLKAEKFFNESDSSPAYYNSNKYGNNNRQGYALEIEAKLLSTHLTVNARWVDAQVIKVKQWSSNEQSFFINLETDDVTF